MQTLEEFLKDKTLPVTVDFEGSPHCYPVTIHFYGGYGAYIGQDNTKGVFYIGIKLSKNWFIAEPPKPKVKRAQYLINHEKGLPFQTRIFYKDDNECLADRPRFLRKTIKRLTETEREIK